MPLAMGGILLDTIFITGIIKKEINYSHNRFTTLFARQPQ